MPKRLVSRRSKRAPRTFDNMVLGRDNGTDWSVPWVRRVGSEKAKQILRTAERLFAGGRYHEVTLDDICKEARVGKGTVYRYFKDKEDLFWKVIFAGLDELVDSVREVDQQGADPREALRLLVNTIAEFFRQRGALFALVWSAQFRGSAGKKRFRKEWQKRNEGTVQVAASFIARGMEEGTYETSFRPAMAAELLMGMVWAAARNWQQMPEDWPSEVVQLFENGILVRDGSRQKGKPRC